MPGSSTRYERIKTRPAYEQVAEAIERRILSGRLRPGDPVGTESELVRQFGVNRSTVREGIRLLEHTGLVTRAASRRLSVAVPHYDRLSTRMSRALILQQVTFRELWHTSCALEQASVAQAVENRTVEDIAALEANLALTARKAKNAETVAECDADFHRLIGEAAHNRILMLAKEPSSLLVRPTTAQIISKNLASVPRMIEAHRAIVKAIAARDKDAALTWVDRHLRDWRKGFEKLEIGLDEPVSRLAAAVNGSAEL